MRSSDIEIGFGISQSLNISSISSITITFWNGIYKSY